MMTRIVLIHWISFAAHPNVCLLLYNVYLYIPSSNKASFVKRETTCHKSLVLSSEDRTLEHFSNMSIRSIEDGTENTVDHL